MLESFTNTGNIETLLQPGLCHYLILGMILFLIGVIILISSTNLVKIIIGFGFMLNSACINFIAANSFLTNNNAAFAGLIPTKDSIINNFAPIESLKYTFIQPEGQVAALLTGAISAINIATMLGLVLIVYFKIKNINTSSLNTLKSADCPSDKDLENESGL